MIQERGQKRKHRQKRNHPQPHILMKKAHADKKRQDIKKISSEQDLFPERTEQPVKTFCFQYIPNTPRRNYTGAQEKKKKEDPEIFHFL
jgi:hypothetical protein